MYAATKATNEVPDGSLLQEAGGRALHDGLRLAQAVHLLVERSLAGVEVVEREVAALVEVRVLVHELLQLVQRGGQLLLRRHLRKYVHINDCQSSSVSLSRT